MNKTQLTLNLGWSQKLLLAVIFLCTISVKSNASVSGTLATGTAPTATTLCAGATDQPIYSFSVKSVASGFSSGDITISNLSGIKITGFAYGDVTSFKLYYSTSNTFSTANPVVCSVSSPTAAPGGVTFTAGTSVVISASFFSTPTYYFWITADISSGATNGSTVKVTAALSSSNVTGATTGSSAVENLMTIGNPTISGANAAFCAGATESFTAATGGTWSSSNSLAATVSASGVVRGIAGAGGTSAIAYTIGSCVAQVTATVNPLPTPVSGTTTVCSGLTTTLSGPASGGTWTSVNTLIATVDAATGLVGGQAAGATTISYTNSCGTGTVTVTVGAPPPAITGNFGMCTSTTNTLADATPSGAWTISGAATGTTINVTTGKITSLTTVGVENVIYAIGGCSVTATVVVGSVTPAVITPTVATTVCPATATTLGDATTGGFWSSSDGSIANVSTTGVVTGVSTGTATISYNTGCGSPTYRTKSITVSGSTAAALSYSSAGLTGPVCSGGTLQLNAATAAGGTYSFTGPNSFSQAATSATIPSVTVAASGVYTFVATFSGCTATANMFVAVDAVPTVAVTASPATICTGGASVLSDVVSAPTTGNYEVDAIPYGLVALTSPTAGPTGDDANSGAITLPFSFNYYGTAYSSIYICTNGWVSFTATGTGYYNNTYPSTAAPLTSIAFTETDLNPTSGGTISYQTVGTTPNREFVVYYNAVAAYGGSGTITGQIILHETTNAIDMMINQSNIVPSYSGDSTTHTFGIQNATGTVASVVPGMNAVSNTNTITTPQGWRFEQPSYNYSWSAATGLSSVSVATTTATGLTATQVYTVTTVNSNSGCTAGNSSTATVTVVAQPTVTVTASNAAICTGGTETLAASATGGTGTQTYTWSGPGITTTTGTTATPAAYTPTAAATTIGAYSVAVAYSGSGCTTATASTSSVTINPQVAISTFTVSAATFCSGGSETLTPSVTGGTGTLSYKWSGPGIATTTTTTSPLVTTPTVSVATTGAYSLSVSASGIGCTSTVTATSASVAVKMQPTVTVSASNTSLCTGGTETLVASPAGGAATATYTWSGPGITTNTGTTATPLAYTPTVATTTTGAYSVAVAYSGSGCVTATGSTASVTINPQVAISTFTVSAATLCSGGSETLTPSVTGGTGTLSYKWSGPGIATTTTTTSPLVTTPTVSVATTGTYSLSVSASGIGCTSTVTATSASVAIKMQPTVSVTASPLALCSGGSLTLASATSGGAGTATYTWSGPGIATVTGSATSPIYTPTTSTGSYSVALNYSGLGCNTARATSSSVSVNAQPSVTLSASSPVTFCAGTTETLTATASNGAGTPSYSWKGPGITGTAGPFSTATYTATAGTTTTAGAYTVAVSYSVSTGCNTTTNTTGIITPTTQQWMGATSTSWSNGANWACGFAPTITQDVLIPGAGAYTYAPTLDVANGYAKNLTINATAAVTLSSTNVLNVAGNLENNSTVSGGIVNLNGSSAQLLSGMGQATNLTLNNAAGATIDTTSDSVGITGTLLVTSGTFTTNGKLTLVSNAAGTAKVGTIGSGGAVSGNVTIQQYIAGGRRAYRFIAHPYSTALPLSQLEQYIDITGVGGSTNGFTSTVSNASSAFWYNPMVGNSAVGTDPGWKAFSSTNGTDTNAFGRYQGVRMYFRGAKGQGLDGGSYIVAPVTYITSGPINQGAQTITLKKGTGANEDYNLIGNPYASPVDIGTVLQANSTSIKGGFFYIWNPQITPNGGFRAVMIGNTDTHGATTYFLGANESFEVRTMSNAMTLPFAETNKADTVSQHLLRSTYSKYLTLNVYDDDYNVWDMLSVNFNDAATDHEDARYDGGKPPSPQALNFYSISADSTKLCFDARPFSAGKVIPLGIKSAYAQEFIIRAENVADLPDSGLVFLHDKYLETYTLMNQDAEYKFTISKDAASQGDNRFELSMRPASVATVQSSKNLDVQMLPNPASSEVTISYTAAAKEQTTVRLMNVAGETVLTQNLGVQQTGSVTVAVDKLVPGMYMVELTSGTDRVVHRLVKE